MQGVLCKMNDSMLQGQHDLACRTPGTCYMNIAMSINRRVDIKMLHIFFKGSVS